MAYQNQPMRGCSKKIAKKARPYDNLAAAYIKSGRNQEAVTYLLHAITLEPTFYEADSDPGEVLMNLAGTARLLPS